MRYFFLAITFVIGHLSAQDYQIAYTADIKTMSGKLWSGPTTLIFNDTTAVFIHNNWPKESDFFEKDGFFTEIMEDNEYMKIYTDLTQRKLHQKVNYSTPSDWNFIFIDTLPQISWKILAEERELSGISVVKARGEYGNRKYTSWFAPSIPVPYGPYHFGGLPGAILEIKSDDGLVSYLFNGFSEKPDSSTFKVSPPIQGKFTTHEKFEKWVIQRLLKAESMSTGTVTTTNGNPHPDYDIIKNRWTIILDYKRERGY